MKNIVIATPVFLPRTEAAVCSYTEKYCRNCRYFDSGYHGGYCDYHKKDTDTFSTCGSWWWNGR